jgi:hypothetical protein
MKKLIQVSLIVIVIFVALSMVIGGMLMLVNAPYSNQAQNAGFTTTTSMQNAQVLTCLGSQRNICIRPDVGWNS